MNSHEEALQAIEEYEKAQEEQRKRTELFIYSIRIAHEMAVDNDLFRYVKRIEPNPKDENKRMWVFSRNEIVESTFNRILEQRKSDEVTST